MQKISGECNVQENKVIVIAGPTASGKSAMAIDIALALNGVVVNADSMQVYKDMPIITAAPTAEDKAKVEHRGYEIFDPSFRGNVMDWLKIIVEEIRDIWKSGKIPVVVGGTGLYIEHLIKGANPIPDTPETIRQKVQKVIDNEGIEVIYKKLKDVDPVMAKKLNPRDVSRVKRAYEVYLNTKEPMSSWQKKPLIQFLPEAQFFIIKICPDVEELDKLAFERFDKMMELGAIEEVQALYKKKLKTDLPAMKALGIPELMEYFTGKTNIYVAVQNAKLHTRQYAKRQRTWFRNRLQADYVFPKCYKGRFPQEVMQLLKTIINK
ncbi:MAG: tRNA (adenosine(37)-N6)-dimethylallyltransferase MiaA [Alphaproteobacteria bacterium]|nr:tRNA (adenosine(37)-N6)-dimethylallyltransferase MiaA [Alphaproteobacteria bacterium]